MSMRSLVLHNCMCFNFERNLWYSQVVKRWIWKLRIRKLLKDGFGIFQHKGIVGMMVNLPF
ncbi:hypothetical protein Hdeb2414_s0008g00290951 [Helianthus debilis subsp. tardiflorus]